MKTALEELQVRINNLTREIYTYREEATIRRNQADALEKQAENAESLRSQFQAIVDNQNK